MMKRVIGGLVAVMVVSAVAMAQQVHHHRYGQSYSNDTQSQAVASDRFAGDWDRVVDGLNSLNLDEKRKSEALAIVARYREEPRGVGSRGRRCRAELKGILSAQEMAKLDAFVGWCGER